MNVTINIYDFNYKNGRKSSIITIQHRKNKKKISNLKQDKISLKFFQMGPKLQISFFILAILVFAMAVAIPDPVPGLLDSLVPVKKPSLLERLLKPITGLLSKVLGLLGRR
ncbi:UNVERIFIED_CONTAM: hypothetical protein RMT77_013713 [Armadillidium vulgare]